MWQRFWILIGVVAAFWMFRERAWMVIAAFAGVWMLERIAVNLVHLEMTISTHLAHLEYINNALIGIRDHQQERQ